MLSGKPSFDPSTYGTTALKQVIRNPEVSRRDGVAAAEELATRTLGVEDGYELFELMKLNKHSSITVALLQTIAKQNMGYLRNDLQSHQADIRDPDTAAESASTVYQFIHDDAEKFEFMKNLLLNSSHANVRARAVRVLSSYNEEAEDAFIAALEHETSASAATAMCEALQKFGTPKSLTIINKIANDIHRVYVADNVLGERATAETVRAAAVRAHESFVAQW